MDSESLSDGPVGRFDAFLNDEIDERNLSTDDLYYMLASILARLRMVHKVEEVADGVLFIAHLVEEKMKAGVGLLDPDTGLPGVYLLAEEREELGLESGQDLIPDDLSGEAWAE